MVETPRKRKVTDFSIDRIVDKKRRTKQARVMALPMGSTVENRLPDQENDEEDDEGLPEITFLPRAVRTQIQRNTSATASTHNGVSTADQSVIQLSSPISEQRQPPVYVVEEEDSRRHNSSDVVDLTVDTGEIVDLTSSYNNNNNSVVVITSEQEFLNERPSCRYSGVQITGEKRPSVIISAPKEPKKKAVTEKENSSAKPGIDVTCPICLDKAEQFRAAGRMLVSTVCGHLFCDDCIKKTVQELHQCPTCRKKLNRKQYHPVYI